MQKQPHTARPLTFTPINEKNFLTYQSWFVDKGLLRWIEFPTLTWLEYVMNTPGIFAWIIYEEDIALGQIQLDTDKSGVGYVGIVVNPEFQNRGYGKSVLRTLLNRKEVKSLKRIEASIEPDNIASQRCFSGVGFVLQMPEQDEESFLHFVYEI